MAVAYAEGRHAFRYALAKPGIEGILPRQTFIHGSTAAKNNQGIWLLRHQGERAHAKECGQMKAEAQFRGRQDHAVEVVEFGNPYSRIDDSQMERTE